ncbi:bifunctional (p)ppGpp synthetase/guanosine-3',5'-bis(diphosphate) 3'-pyrophosphohydrolase [Thiomicrorhabdus indica]|uniref:RelA/SpoT family protein n=1 Tax=Thiomicrorhabdus indica TaxID=2267253 RepID=UPI002AA7EC56|nr:bifunctional (p)ppGpp synthetase/guanosine-3',5'-bis(diphosphate) 3'-pyrophosphohydrolase [Thiomicrorhabdus indica]
MATPTSTDALIEKVSTYLNAEQVARIKQAFEFGRIAHDGQKRKAGGDYIWHPVAVAEILADIQLDQDSIIAALLHDVIEDTPYTKEDITELFGESVAEIVEGVTKLTKMMFSTPQQAKAENFRKMIMAMSRDIRVILIKLADRLHNMRTLGVMRRDKQRRIAEETLEFFAPIAGRLGINSIRIELEDLCFRIIYPMRHAALEKALLKARGHRNEIIAQITQTIEHRLEQEKIPGRVFGREKHLYSLYKKMKNKGKHFDEILDIFAFRVIVDSPDSCYRALGAMHSLYKPLPNRFKDYIAIPKSNGYQALHTTLFGPFSSARLEIQIRSEQMHDVAEHGIAAHWLYKQQDDNENSASSTVDQKAQEWVKNLLELQKSAGNSLDFLENVKIDLFPDVIYVFTPKGDIISLPRGATALDFAYAVHTNVGHSAVSCHIDNKLRPLRTTLHSGNTVDVVRGRLEKPNPSWLQFVKTAKARTQIRHYMRDLETEDAILLGKEILKRALHRFNMQLDGLSNEQEADILQALEHETLNQLFEELGTGKRLAPLIAKQIHDIILGREDTVESTEYQHGEALPITGTEGFAVQFANCCHPIPGDEIIGYLSAEKGLMIHRENCTNIRKIKAQPDKLLDVHWAEDVQGSFLTELQLEVKNVRGSLATIASEIASTQTDIDSVTSEDKDDQYSLMNFILHVRDRNHLAHIIKALKKNKLVEKIQRM